MTNPLIPTAEEALAEWARRVRANREQAERVREEPESSDFYAPVARNFAANPRRTDEPLLEGLLGLAQRDETWLDIGAGGGRYALPLALRVREVIALDPSDGMLAVLREGMSDHGIGNIRIVQSRWPSEEDVTADVALIAHVGYDIEGIGPFLDAMERSAKRLCVAVLLSRAPAALAEPFWPEIHGEPRAPLPALPEFLALQLARGRICEVQLFEREGMSYDSPEMPLAWLRQQLFIAAGGDKERRAHELARELMTERDGRWALSWEAWPIGVVSWAPPRQG